MSMWQGEGLPDVAGPTALLLRSVDGALLKAEAVPAFNNAELPGGPICFKGPPALPYTCACARQVAQSQTLPAVTHCLSL